MYVGLKIGGIEFYSRFIGLLHHVSANFGV